MTGHNYPDHFYADALAKDEKPAGAYRAPAEMPEAERKLRTALAYVCHARDLIMQALGDDKVVLEWPTPNRPVPERVPKWDPAWGVPITERKGYSQGSHTGNPGPIPQNAHPLNAETIRDHDERLSGAEDRL